MTYTDDQGEKCTTSDNEQIANILNDQFSLVFNRNVAENTSSSYTYTSGSNDMEALQFNVQDIAKRLNNLNCYKSAGPDCIHPKILKELGDVIAVPLKLIFKCSFATKSLPEDWISATITPIFTKVRKMWQPITGLLV